MSVEKTLERRKMLLEIANFWDYVALECEDIESVRFEVDGIEKDMKKEGKLTGKHNVSLQVKIKNKG